MPDIETGSHFWDRNPLEGWGEDRQDGDGLRDPLERLLAAFKGMMPFPLVVQAVAEGLVRDAETALATAPTRDAAEGAGKTLSAMALVEGLRLYPTLNENDPHYAKRECFIQGYVIGAQSAATPQPAPDVMREAANRLLEYAKTWGPEDDTNRPSLKDDIELVCKAALAAPVPSPDGAGEVDFLLRRALRLSDQEKFALAAQLAEDVGYDLVEESATGSAEPDATLTALAMRLRASADHDGPQELKMVMRRIASAIERLAIPPVADAILSLSVPPGAGEREKALRDEIFCLREVVRGVRILDHAGRFKEYDGEPWLRRVRNIGLDHDPVEFNRQPPQSSREG